MSLFTMIAVLLIEQIRPLPYAAVVGAPLERWAGWLEARFNAGGRSRGIVAWLLGVGSLVLVSGIVYALLYAISPVSAWIWSVLILYLTMGFRQFSHYYTDIQLALRLGDLSHAREVLGEWCGVCSDDLSAAAIARESIRCALAASHTHVFGVVVCYVLLPGPCGAVMYRTGAFFADRWGNRAVPGAGDFGGFARQAFAIIDWLPARLTAAAFAVVGNFENAVYCWRAQASGGIAEARTGRNQAVVVAAGVGALGSLSAEALDNDVGGGVGSDEESGLDLMQSAVGLVWRALLLCLLLLILFELARLVAS